MPQVISLADAGLYYKRMSDKMKAAAVRGLHSAAHRLHQKIVTEIIPEAVPQPVDRGLYRAGWRVLELEDRAVVYNVEPHASIVEHGVRASAVKIGRVMLQALAEWAQRHGFEDPEGAAWAIAKTIKKRGIVGRRILEKAIGYAPGLIREEVQREIADLKKGRK